ncbi:MAG TPA: TonB family protein [Segetibacter sp.]
MLPFFYYLLKVMICSGVLYGYYLLVLRNKKFHQYNRWYLLSAVALSFIIPLIKIGFWKESVEPSTVMKAMIFITETDAYIAQQTPFINWESIVVAGFIFTSLVFLFLLIISLLKILFLLKSHPKKLLKNIWFVFSTTPGTPFSFFKYIFWNPEIDIESNEGKHILNHELVHVKEKHSSDKLFLNLMLVVGWYNPFLWLIRSELNMIHEFIADQKVVREGDAHSFAMMLLKVTYPTQQFPLSNSFFHSPIKRRLIMLTKSHKPRFSYLSRLVILPLIVIVFALFAFKIKKSNNEQGIASSNKNYTLQAINAVEDTLKTQSYTEVGIRVVEGKKMIYTKDTTGKVEVFDGKDAVKRFGFNEKDVDRWLSGKTNKIVNEEDTIPKAEKFDKVFTRVENPPAYKGNFSEYLKANLNFPDEARNKKIEGKVTIKFIVDEDGELSSFKPLTSLGNGLEDEAIRLIKNSSPWKPAIQNGRKVVYEVMQEIDFALSKQEMGSENIIPAEFPGGTKAWKNYLERNLNATVLAANRAPAGKYAAIIVFNVSRNGKVSNIKAETKQGYGTEEESIRIIKTGPKWVPAKRDGTFVDSQVRQTITFMVSE